MVVLSTTYPECGLWTSDWLLVHIHGKISTGIENKHVEISAAICLLNVIQDLESKRCLFSVSFSSYQLFNYIL